MEEDEEHLKRSVGRSVGCVISIKEVSSSIVRPSVSPSTSTPKGWNESKTRQLRADCEIFPIDLMNFAFLSNHYVNFCTGEIGAMHA